MNSPSSPVSITGLPTVTWSPEQLSLWPVAQILFARPDGGGLHRSEVSFWRRSSCVAGAGESDSKQGNGISFTRQGSNCLKFSVPVFSTSSSFCQRPIVPVRSTCCAAGRVPRLGVERCAAFAEIPARSGPRQTGGIF